MISLQKKLLILTRIVVLFHLNLHNIIIGIKNHPFLQEIIYNSFFKKEGSNKDIFDRASTLKKGSTSKRIIVDMISRDWHRSRYYSRDFQPLVSPGDSHGTDFVNNKFRMLHFPDSSSQPSLFHALMHLRYMHLKCRFEEVKFTRISAHTSI